jgi:hypothetical protein
MDFAKKLVTNRTPCLNKNKLEISQIILQKLKRLTLMFSLLARRASPSWPWATRS